MTKRKTTKAIRRTRTKHKSHRRRHNTKKRNSMRQRKRTYRRRNVFVDSATQVTLFKSKSKNMSKDDMMVSKQSEGNEGNMIPGMRQLLERIHLL
jgi:hypothetical protein